MREKAGNHSREIKMTMKEKMGNIELKLQYLKISFRWINLAAK